MAGRLADFIVLDRDPIAAPVDALEDAGVTGVVVRGAVVRWPGTKP